MIYDNITDVEPGRGNKHIKDISFRYPDYNFVSQVHTLILKMTNIFEMSSWYLYSRNGYASPDAPPPPPPSMPGTILIDISRGIEKKTGLDHITTEIHGLQQPTLVNINMTYNKIQYLKRTRIRATSPIP